MEFLQVLVLKLFYISAIMFVHYICHQLWCCRFKYISLIILLFFLGAQMTMQPSCSFVRNVLDGTLDCVLYSGRKLLLFQLPIDTKLILVQNGNLLFAVL